MTLFLNAAYASSAVTLASPNPQLDGNFGQSVAISGTTVVVGAPGETASLQLNAGNAYVFDAASGSLVSTLTTRNAVTFGDFGASVAISGTTVVVGAAGETAGGFAGHAYVFDATTGDLIRTLTSPSARFEGDFGQSVAISGTTVVVGAPRETVNFVGHVGNAYVFDAASGSLISTL